MSVRILTGDCRELLRELPDASVQCCVTSPPYFGLRDYGVAGQIGLEDTPDAFVAEMVAVFREVRRVLRDDGVLWLNLGDSYFSTTKGSGGSNPATSPKQAWKGSGNGQAFEPIRLSAGALPLKPKDLIGIPWRVAFALQADGWWLRQDIIWHKPNPMPESVTDRCTKAHEYLFLLSKSATYHYDAGAIKEAAIHEGRIVKASGGDAKNAGKGEFGATAAGFTMHDTLVTDRNKRSVWTVATQPFSEAHFATFPPALIQPCILAGTSEKGCCPHCGSPWLRLTERPAAKTIAPISGTKSAGAVDAGRMSTAKRRGSFHGPGWRDADPDITITTGWAPTCDCPPGDPVPCTVLDPFGGAGTTGLVADRLGRSAILIELNPAYASIADGRIRSDAGLFAAMA